MKSMYEEQPIEVSFYCNGKQLLDCFPMKTIPRVGENIAVSDSVYEVKQVAYNLLPDEERKNYKYPYYVTVELYKLLGK